MNTLLESNRNSVKSKTLKVVFICTTVSGVSYYRMAAFAWAMRKWPRVETVVWPYSSQITVQNPWQVDMIDRPDVRERIDYLCDKADIVVWQGLDFSHSLEFFQEMKARHQKPFLTELDDYISDVPVENEAYEQFKPGSVRHRLLMSQIANSDGLIVSTPYLAKQYEGLHGNIHIVPNSIDLSAWKGLENKKHERIRIGWIGGGTHSRDLEMVQPVIEDLTKQYKNVWFYCIHGVPQVYKEMKKVYWTHRWATINIYPRFMASFKFDIGIAPLIDNNFNRGKSNLRWLEYSALKIPTVASPLPDFTRSIVSGHNGFLVNDLQEWKEALTLLIEDEQTRRSIGDSAYKSIKDNFNVSKTAVHYMRILREFL